MDFDQIATLADRSPAWRLLRARNAPLVLSFLGQVFVEENSGALPAATLRLLLEDHLHAVNTGRGQDVAYGAGPATYLDDWAAAETGWLRRFYPPDSEEVHLDATPALEKAYAWVVALGARSFVGTESRLHTLVELLRQIAHGSQDDPQTRLAELERRRAEIDREIEEVRAGRVQVMDGGAMRERYQHFSTTARELLSDFREVEENFRALDRAARERIATWSEAKGALLESLVGDRTDIATSDQGRSFNAFYEFLLSQDRQDELSELLARVQSLSEIRPDARMRTVHHEWFDAAERTQQTVRRLSEQLRRFLDDQVWLENRRVMDLVRSIEVQALKVRDSPPRLGLAVDEAGLGIHLPFERPLYDVRAAVEVDSSIRDADGEDLDLDTAALFEQVFVDTARLAGNVRAVVPPRSTADLDDIVGLYPVQDGIAEIVGYLALNEDDIEVVVDQTGADPVRLDYLDLTGRARVVRLPKVTVHRR